jgi:hypothetical protein
MVKIVGAGSPHNAIGGSSATGLFEVFIERILAREGELTKVRIVIKCYRRVRVHGGCRRQEQGGVILK